MLESLLGSRPKLRIWVDHLWNQVLNLFAKEASQIRIDINIPSIQFEVRRRSTGNHHQESSSTGPDIRGRQNDPLLDLRGNELEGANAVRSAVVVSDLSAHSEVYNLYQFVCSFQQYIVRFDIAVHVAFAVHIWDGHQNLFHVLGSHKLTHFGGTLYLRTQRPALVIVGHKVDRGSFGKHFV